MTIHEDKADITALAHAYSDAVNRRDPDGMAAVYATDGVLHVGSTGVTVVGTEKLRKGFKRLVEVDREFLVQMTTSGVVEVEGDRARARWWFVEIKRHTGETRHRCIVGTYQDVAVRLDGGWRFAERTASGLFEWLLPEGSDINHFPLPAFLPIDPLPS